MENTKVIFKNAWPYQQDKMNLPVHDLGAALPFYETIMGFAVTAKQDSPHKSATLSRDSVEIGLAENGGDPGNDGCFFEVDNVEKALEELNSNGLKIPSAIQPHTHGDSSWRLFFVIAPDGLCYSIGERAG
jgi:lactoylglutathione lyase